MQINSSVADEDEMFSSGSNSQSFDEENEHDEGELGSESGLS